MEGRLRPRLAAAVDQWQPGVELVGLERLQGGRSGDTFRVDLANAPRIPSLAVKVAPTGLAPTGNRDVLRQARLLRMLAEAESVCVPEVVLCDPGDPPGLPPLFAMRYVTGETVEPHIDEAVELPAPEDVDRRARHAARLLAALHAVDTGAPGFAGEPVVTIEDELGRWARLFATVPDDLAEGASDVLSVLRASIPAPVPATLVHGDFRLGNMLSRGGNVLAVIDWEIWALGDPRVDLAWFLLTADPGLHPNAVREAPGMPSPEELLDEYRLAGGISLSAPGWFTGLVLFKMAAIVASIVKRHERRGDAGGLATEMRGDLRRALVGARAVLGR